MFGCFGLNWMLDVSLCSVCKLRVCEPFLNLCGLGADLVDFSYLYATADFWQLFRDVLFLLG